MKQVTLAPWAEVVPTTPFPQTVAHLLTRADDGWMYELVEGRLVRMPGSGYADGDALDGTDIVPGFSYPLSRLFA